MKNSGQAGWVLSFATNESFRYIYVCVCAGKREIKEMSRVMAREEKENKIKPQYSCEAPRYSKKFSVG